MRIIMSRKNVQDDVKTKKASLVKTKGDVIIHDGVHCHLKVSMTEEKNVKAVDVCLNHDE